jgi:MFS transporter, FHS family, glucose/mannose:H+ symporter
MAAARTRAAAVAGCVGFLLLGWAGLLIPSLVRSIEHDYGQTDAGLGFFYLVNAVVYGSGVLGGTLLTQRLGRRPVLAGGVGLAAVGLLVLATAGSWPVFIAGVIPFGAGCGTLDGAGNGLILDLFPAARGRALNLLHFCFSAGALACPAIVGRLVEAGVPWRSLLVGTAALAIPIVGLFARAAMPSGRHVPEAGTSAAAGTTAPAGAPARASRLLLDRVLLVLGIAIACYVASEIGLSNWLVRFLEAAPLEVATTALTLYWAGLTVGRLGSARIGDRFDHTAFATAACAATGILILAAVLAPSIGLSIALFAAAGISSGPIFPLIVAIGGDRYPDRSAAVGGYIAGAAVVGGISYPPVMGFLSVTVGLPAAMAGTGGFALLAAVVLLAGRRR